MMRDGRTFGALILTHGRPDTIFTERALRRNGYTGPVWYVCDSDDETLPEYQRRFGHQVIVFDKAQVEADTGDIDGPKSVVIYARQAAWGIARSLGLDYFVELDDDYTSFAHRWHELGINRSCQIRQLDLVFDLLIDFLDVSGAATIAMSQGGDHIGGIGNPDEYAGMLRKAMNSFILRTDRPFDFLGRINEDATAYTVHGARGALFFTVMGLQLTQKPTQSATGGLTDAYLESGTYVKSFYTVMMAPSSTKVAMMGTVARRFHHRTRRDLAAPKIVSSRYRRSDDGE